MLTKRRISVTTGTRAEYGILRPVLQEIVSSNKLELYLIVSGMHLSSKHGMTINQIKKDSFKIFTTVDMIPKGDSTFFMAQALGNGVLRFAEVFRKIKPDINLILGDRDEAFASALAASHMNIPNAHIHGGDKTMAGIDEYNRHAITKISNIHFAATRKSKERIIKMGENSKFVFLTGSPSVDEIVENKITKKEEIEKKYKLKITGEEILLVQHPVTTESEKSKEQILHILNALRRTKRNVIAILPNSDSGNKSIFRYIGLYSRKYGFIKAYSNLPRQDYLGLLRNCALLLGNSSSGIIEAGYLGIPVVNVGIRQKDRETSGTVINVETETVESIYHAIQYALRKKRTKHHVKSIYGNGNASKNIVKYLEKIIIDKELIQKQISY